MEGWKPDFIFIREGGTETEITENWSVESRRTGWAWSCTRSWWESPSYCRPAPPPSPSPAWRPSRDNLINSAARHVEAHPRRISRGHVASVTSHFRPMWPSLLTRMRRQQVSWRLYRGRRMMESSTGVMSPTEQLPLLCLLDLASTSASTVSIILFYKSKKKSFVYVLNQYSRH